MEHEPSDTDESARQHGVDRRARLLRGLAQLVDFRPDEAASLGWSCGYFFTLLFAYSILRPVRESTGLSGGAANLPWLFTGTMVVMMAVNPAFALLVTRLPRRRFVPIVYRVSMAMMLGFWILFRFVGPEYQKAVGYSFYVWVSVFNMFVVSVFWAFMADVWKLEQAKRLFGFIGVGGTLGTILGAAATAWLALTVGTANCLLVTIAFLELSVFCMKRLARIRGIDTVDEIRPVTQSAAETPRAQPGVWHGVRLVASEPYLRSIATYTLLYSLISSILYFQQGFLVEKTIASKDARTALFAHIDLFSNTATLILQVFFTGRLIRRFGITFALVSQPVVAAIGWTFLALSILFAEQLAAHGYAAFGLPAELVVLIAVQVLLRSSNFATAKPAREALYTVVGREEKYKSKSFIDTLVYRFGDWTGAMIFKGLGWMGLGLTGIAFVPVPLAAVWIVVGAVLGRRQRELTQRMDALPPN